VTGRNRIWADSRCARDPVPGRARTGPCSLVAERVLDLLAGLLEVGLHLVALAFGFQPLVVGDLAGSFLGLAGDVFRLVADLVIEPHLSLHVLADTDSGTHRW